MKIAWLPLLLTMSLPLPALSGGDTRQRIKLPEPMRQHMLANMRDHLAALHEIQQGLGTGAFAQAAKTAETRIGMSSLASHGAAHMAPHMPEAMRAIGSRMHTAASRFAVIAEETAVDGNSARAMAALSEVTALCVACHAGFRVH